MYLVHLVSIYAFLNQTRVPATSLKSDMTWPDKSGRMVTLILRDYRGLLLLVNVDNRYLFTNSIERVTLQTKRC